MKSRRFLVGAASMGALAAHLVSTSLAAAADAPPPPVAEDVADVGSAVGVERLTAGAYPEPQVRGIRGGSLGLTFHGLQWPYMPAGPGGAPRLVLGLSGWAWVDTGYERIKPGAGSPSSDKITYWLQQGRILLRATPTYSVENWFVQAQVELVGNGDQTVTRAAAADTDDLWVRVGRWNAWDVQIGRYEAWEVFHLGMGLDLNTIERRGAATDADNPSSIDFYGVTDLYYRSSGTGDVALHLYPSRFVRFELLGQAGNPGGVSNQIGGRPAVIADLGWFKLKGAFEYSRQTPTKSSSPSHKVSQGVGGTAQFILNPRVEAGLNAAQGTVQATDGQGRPDLRGSFTRTSVGAFANARLIGDLVIGAGVVYTTVKDTNVYTSVIVTTPRVDMYSHLQAFGAIQYIILKQLYVKLVLGYARAHYEDNYTDTPTPYSNTMLSARIRVGFYF
jgi:hypothetical protein